MESSRFAYDTGEHETDDWRVELQPYKYAISFTRHNKHDTNSKCRAKENTLNSLQSRILSLALHIYIIITLTTRMMTLPVP